MIVADTNLIAYLFIPGEHTSLAEKVLLKDPEWIAPALWRSEFRNILSLYMREQNLPLKTAQTTMDQAERLLEAREFVIPSDKILETSFKTSLSAYDAEFVTLADAKKIKLVTLDKKILKKAPHVSLSPAEFI